MALMELVLALAVLLPLAPQPAAPFPKIITDAPTISEVAPGVSYGDYQMLTADGPLSVHVVAVDLKNPTIRIGTALAQNKLVSPGETVSSMAQRTGAVAGVNGDYFDINQTNQPLNILVQDGRLVRMPMHRWAISFTQSKEAHFAEFAIEANATLPGGTVPLKTLNDWPPPGGGAVFVTPEYGTLRAAPDVTEIAVQPDGGTPPFSTYRVTSIVDNTATQPPGYYLAIGPNAYNAAPIPNPGDTVAIGASFAPALNDVVSAIGGGPLLVQNGAWFADPDGPSKGEFATHMPATSVGITREGTLLFFEIDGRQPAFSIGVLQPQLAALMIAFGVQDGMQFDGGGSSTIVARLPGDANAAVQNSPSDGVERRVADGLFVYSDAPQGPPARLYAMPQVVRALPGARVPIRVAITDYAGHPSPACRCVRMQVVPGNAGTIDGDTFVAGKRPADAVVRVEAGTLRTQVPVEVTADVARTQILPEHPALRTGETLQLAARAFDARGYPIALPADLPWTTAIGAIDVSGRFIAAQSDTLVSVRIGDKVAAENITVGEHEERVPLEQFATFSSAPRNGPGGVEKGDPCPLCTTLRYDFTSDERAAYLDATLRLPERALAVAADVFGDANGETLRLAVNNAINERFLYTVAKVDWHGWRRVEFRFPDALPQPITFKSLYVINRVGPAPAVQASGSIAVRNFRVVLAGSAQSAPK